MNVQRNELSERYREKVLQVATTERDRGRMELIQSATNYLNTADPQQRFSEQIVVIFSTNIAVKTSLDMAAARNVFLIMEKYVINILDCPWKREFRKITMYSGFYKTRIEPILKDAWKLLTMIGYEKVGLCLELRRLPDAIRLQDVALEFYLASLECSIYKDIFQKVSSSGFTLKDIHKCRRNNSGNVDVLSRVLSKVSFSDKRGESSKTENDFSNLSERQQFEKYSGYEANVGCGVPAGVTLPEGSQQQMASLSKALPPPDEGMADSGCETRTESIEAMLQEITPEMISDANIRKQILTKLTARPQSAKSEDDLLHAALLPPQQTQRESNARAHTEPLLIPKQPKLYVASDVQPYTEPLAMPRQSRPILPSGADRLLFMEPNIRKTERKILPNIQPYIEPLPVQKQKFTVVSDQRPFTEPLLIPKQEKVPSKPSSKSTENIFTRWQCAHCFFANKTAGSVEKCESCGYSRKEV